MAFTTTHISLMGFDFLLEIDFDITFRGGPRTYWDAPEEPEWDCDTLVLRLGDIPFEATGALFSVLANSPPVTDAILKYIDNTNDLDWLEYDEDFYREP